MKNLALKYKRTIGLVLLLSTAALYPARHANQTMITLCKHFVPGEKALESLFDSSNTNSFAHHVEYMDSIIQELKGSISAKTRSGATLNDEINKIFLDIHNQFRDAITVLQKFIGKSSKDANQLVVEFLAVLNPNTFFEKLEVKLNGLKARAITEDDKNLTVTIERFITFVKAKEKTWQGKSRLALFGALCRRMDRK